MVQRRRVEAAGLSRIRSYERQGEGALSRRRSEDAAEERSRWHHQGGAQQGQGRRPRLRLWRLGGCLAPHRPDDERSDAEIFADVRAWRDAHPRTVEYWRELSRAIRIAIRTGQPFTAGKIVASYEDGNLYLALPSGRRISYPEARLGGEQV